MQKHKLIIYQMTMIKNIALDVAVDKIKKVDNFEMIIEEHNIEDGLFYAKEDYWKKQMLKGDRSSEQ